jgi:cation diffusion facilitator CzcD-associated flavoprotein CzcO
LADDLFLQAAVPPPASAGRAPAAPRIAIVGAGFAGLCLAIRLKQAGIQSLTIYEQAADIGGTWRDNRYPGAACDIESHLYSYSFEPKPDWSRRYAPQNEILGYLRHCVDKHALQPHLRLNTGVIDAAFDERARLWRLRLANGETAEAELLVSAAGAFGQPAWPQIPGLRSFAGTLMHSARWQPGYDFTGQRVAVIGTGASAIQIVPELARTAREVRVFQRTPAWILPKRDRAISGLERGLLQRWPLLQWLLRQQIYWRLETLALGLLRPALVRHLERRALRHLRRQVPDAALREPLTPHYALGCKRILWSNDFYPALQRGNVRLVTQPIAAVSADTLTTVDGESHAVDAVVCATGFRVVDGPLPFTVTGLNGRTLYQAWAGGAEAYLGTAVAGFPNLFFLVGPNSGLGHSSMILMIEAQAGYVLDALRQLRERGARLLLLRAPVQQAYNEQLRQRLGRSVWNSGCNSWYRNKAGKNSVIWPGFAFEFRRLTARLDPEDYEFLE